MKRDRRKKKGESSRSTNRQYQGGRLDKGGVGWRAVEKGEIRREVTDVER